MKRWIFILVILGIAAIGGTGYLGYRSSQPQVVVTPQAPPTVAVNTCSVEQTITAPGSLVNTRETKIEMPLTGHTVEILVRAGDSVKAGQILARLGDQEQFDAAVAAAQLDLLQVRQARADLDANAPVQLAEAEVAVANGQQALEKAQKDRKRLDYPRASAAIIDEAKAKLALAEDRLRNAQTEYENLSNLSANDPERAAALLNLSNAQREQLNALATLNWYLGNPSQTDISAADAALALAQAQLTQAQAARDRLKAGPDALAVSLADAKVVDAQAKLASAQKALASLVIQAPFNGIILEVAAQAGETYNAGASLFTLNNPTAVEVESTVIEEDFPYVEIGQPASLFFDALPSETITGTVARILPKRAAGDRPLYTIFITLDHVPAKLVAGMSADASIIIAQRKGVLCLPRAIVQAAANGTAVVDVWANGQKEKRTVKVGLRGDTSIEILSGLKAGELVVVK